MLLPPRSQLHRLTDSDLFLWATGIEDTFITDPWPATGRTLDQYDLTGHYRRWEEDLSLMAGLGLKTARYGIPWHRVNPAKGRWDWTWADSALERLLGLGISPIVDLVHYGVPGWTDGAFLHPDYPEHVAEYAARLAERYRGRIRWYTPLNEPRITAWYCGRLGWWPPYRRGWRGFVAVMLGVCKGMARTQRALRSADPENVVVHVDAADLYTSEDPTLTGEVERRREVGYLALDLIGGKVDREHPLWDWLLRQGAGEGDLDEFLNRPESPDLLGLNLYPMFSQKRLVRTPGGPRLRMSYGSGETVERITEGYGRRYGLPMMITETASRGSIARRIAWLEESVGAVRRLRSRGIPLVGYTWWPMLALVAWAYRQGSRPVGEYIEQMGLWDLDPDLDAGLRRIATPLTQRYRDKVAGGMESVGPLRPTP